MCKDCNTEFLNHAATFDHIETKHLVSFPGYRCVLCNYVYQTWLIFKQHVINVHCSNPQQTKDSIDRLPSRITPNYSRTPKISFSAIQTKQKFNCSICYFSSTNEEDLNVHKRSVHQICIPPKRRRGPNINPTIGKGKSNFDGLRLKCHRCAILFNDPEEFKQHNFLKHSVIERKKCLKCDIVFDDQVEFKKHNYTKHSVIEVVDTSKTLKMVDQVTDPGLDDEANEVNFVIPVYKTGKPAQMSELAKALKRSSETGEHHTRVRSRLKKMEPYADTGRTHCSYCIKTFLTKELCLEHEKSHSGVMAYNCHICEKRGFRQRVRYLTHMSQTHKITIENAYSLVHCTHCNKTLMSQTDLEYHEEKEHSVQILINKSYDALAAQNVSKNIDNTLVENVI